MKIYRTNKYRFWDEHDGYVYHATKKEAQDFVKAQMKEYKEDRESEDEVGKPFGLGEIDTINFDQTRTGIVKAFQEFGSHPNNG